MTDHKTIFTNIHKTNAWDHGSGPGSIPENCQPWMLYLQNFLAANRIDTICDWGCGDWQHSKHLDFSKCHYTGVDIVEDIVATNSNLYANNNVEFLTPDKLDANQEFDLLIVKEVFIHWPLADIKAFLANPPVKAKHWLVCGSSSYKPNVEIRLGDFRSIVLTAPPFNLPFKETLKWTNRNIIYKVWHRES